MREIAFEIALSEAQADAYRRWNGTIHPDAEAVGISDWAIIRLDHETNRPFVILTLSDDPSNDTLSEPEIVKRWWALVAELLETDADNVPPYNLAKQIRRFR